LHQHIANSRKDFIHKLSNSITNENQVVALESLNIAGMVRNHSLAKSISDCSWAEFVRQLKYKSEWKGGTVIQADRFYPSSKLCSNCGHVKKDLKLSERIWTCEHCHTEHDRDINAANNLLKFALREQSEIGQELTESKPVEKVTSSKRLTSQAEALRRSRKPTPELRWR
jgi:putative transposase